MAPVPQPGDSPEPPPGLDAGTDAGQQTDPGIPDAARPDAGPGAIAHPPLSLDGCRYANEGGSAPAIAGRDRQAGQGYLAPASEYGIDAEYAWTVPGGTGEHVTVADIEFATWNLEHEDLQNTRICFAQNGSGVPYDYSDDHGSGVIGVMAADDNGVGVTGIAHDASLLVVNHSNDRQGFAEAIASALDEATGRLHPGDVILIEANLRGQRGLVEEDRDVYDAIVRAVDAGLIVLQTAGNAGVNLDNASLFGDSGAIVVGGGYAATRQSPLAPTGLNYGRRVDLQGWATDVATLGAGRCNNISEPGNVSQRSYPDCPNDAYRSGFGGTSSAGPIVAGAAAVVSSIAQERGYLLTSREVRELLKETGTPQGGSSGRNVGPLPNLRAAIEALPR